MSLHEGALDVEAINRSLGLALTSDGATVPVTHWLGDGEDCGPHDATVAIAGPDAQGRWHSIYLAEFDPTPSH